MDDVKDKFKGFMKKVSSSSSGKFKGQGRVLGSSSSSDSVNPIHPRPLMTSAQRRESNTASPISHPFQTSNSKKEPPKSHLAATHPDSESSEPISSRFDPFDSYISSGKRALNGVSISVSECPVCGNSYKTEDEVSEHIENCLSTGVENAGIDEKSSGKRPPVAAVGNALEDHVLSFKLSDPSDASVEILLKLLKNIAREPENAKFRRIRLNNPKIKAAIVEMPGGVELLECVGFTLKEEGGETWAQMEVPSNENILLIREVIDLLEKPKLDESSLVVSSQKAAPVEKNKIDKAPVEQKKIDRQTRVYFSVSGNVTARIELPDSFYSLSAQELKQESELRRKKIEESKLLIPKSYKEKQAQAARQRYKETVIRVEFPDGVVLQGIFLPSEPTTALYEFVSSALKEPSLEFELLQPAMPRRRVIPHFPVAGEKVRTLCEEELVPSALVKFKPIETDSTVFSGLRNELLLASEPLTAATGVVLP